MSGQALEFEVFTLFPAMVDTLCAAGLMGKAQTRELVRVHTTDIRDFATDKHRTVDDAPFGGGAGMVLRPDVVVAALEHAARERGSFHRILLTPSAPTFDQATARRLASMSRVGLICGRYEGIDDRVREHFVDECLSIGDFVLTGGEVAAAAIIEAVSRLREGVLGNPASAVDDSFSDPRRGPLLEHPHYTRPAEFRGHEVPPVLMSGDHGNIARWRRLSAGRRTWELRPQLRPQRTLSEGHSVWLVVGDPEDVDAVRSAAWPRLSSVVTAPSRSELVRQIKRQTGRSPWIIGLGNGAPHACPVIGALPALLDLLELAADETCSAIPPLAFVWPQAIAQRMGARLWFAPTPRAKLRAPLATEPSMVDISQPRSGETIAALARSLSDALEQTG